MLISHNVILRAAGIALALLLPATATLSATARPAKGGKKVVGVVTDSITGERLSFVNVWSKSAKSGTTTDLNGVFTLYVPAGSRIDVTSLGYEPMGRNAVTGVDTLRFRLSPSTTELVEVVVKPKKEKYSKKNNPAVELMRRVRADRDLHDPSRRPYYSYDRYDKSVLALNDYKGYLPGEDGQVKGRFKAMAEFVDTGVWTGKRILDLTLKEKTATRIMTGDGSRREIVTAQRSNGIDKALDDGYMRGVVEDILREVDVYDNDINVMRNRFVSPLSAIGADFYKYHIVDTVMIGTDRCVELDFAPHNAESMGFNGKLYIPVEDSVKYVRRVMMRLPKDANVNYVENMYLSQNFEKDSLGMVHKSLDDMVVELHVVGPLGRLYAARQSRYGNRSYGRREDLAQYYDRLGNTFMIEDAESRGGDYWAGARMLPLSYAERLLSTEESPYKKLPLMYWTGKIAAILVKGYISTSPDGRKSKFDIGPFMSFVSFNDTEGLRLSAGGMTTANLCDRLFGRGYVAYGFKDRKWKYNAELDFSFNRKKYHSQEFPMNDLRLSYRYDINMLGQRFLSDGGRTILNSLTRMESNLSVYERLGKLTYVKEWNNHLSLNVTAQYRRLEASNYVHFVKADGTLVPNYTQNSLKIGLRWAPGEKFIQTYNARQRLNRDAWVFNLSHEFGPKGLLGSEYTLNLTEMSVEKRFWFSAFGYTDILVKGGKLWNQVQFPALLWQNANISYFTGRETFSLLNPMEFAMDEYASLEMTYNMNGLIFNRIPLIKKLKLREIVTFKGFVGHLSDKNNPEYNPDLFRFPAQGVTQPMGHTPYMEIGAGIDNILTVLRVEYLWRLSYRGKPGCPDSGLRFSFHFSF